MGATTPVMMLRNLRTGQKLTRGLYYAGGDAIGYIVPGTFNGVAAATSPTDFVLPPGPWAIEYISGPATGRVTIDSDGMPTPIQIDMATCIAQVAVPNKEFGRLAGGNHRYMIRVVSAMAA